MPFDPSTAQAIQSDFDPSTARDINAADSSKEIMTARENVKHPMAYALKNTFDQAIVNPLAQGINAVEPAVRGIVKGIGVPDNKNTVAPVSAPDMSNAPFAAKVEGDVAGGLAQGGAAFAAGGGNPILGFGVTSGLGAYGRGENPIPAAIQGAGSGALQMGAGKLGSTLASAAAKPLGGIVSRFAPNVGTALGMGGISAAMAPEGERTRAAASGAAFGLMSPANPIGASKPVTQEQYNQELEKAGAKYREVLNPGKGIISDVEIKGNKNLDDYYKLAAKEGLIINKDPAGKIDTSEAKQQLQQKTAQLNNQVNGILESNPEKQFNLEDIGAQAKKQLRGRIKNDLDYEQAVNNLQDHIDAAINQHGEEVDGETLNGIKQGMWGKSYDLLKPNAQITARQIGFAAKDAIEKAFPSEDVQGINKRLGDYLTLDTLLDKAHGQVVQKGKIGKYAAQGIGALTGHAVGLPGGEIAGAWAAGKASDIMNDPTRITSGIANKLKRMSVTNPEASQTTRPGTVKPEIINGKTKNMSPIGLPAPLPEYLKERQNMSNKVEVPTGKAESSNPIEIPPTARKNTARYTGGPVMNISPESDFNPLKSPQTGTTTDIPNKVKALGLAGAIGLGSMFNPLNAQAKDNDRLKLPSAQYTQKEEGFKASPYLDTKGVKTIGYGFNMNDKSVAKLIPQAVMEHRRGLTKPEADNIFNKVYANAKINAQKFSGQAWGNLSESQQKALTDMSYQLGYKLNQFKNLRAAVQNGNFNTAAREILNSDYSKQAKNRATRNSILIRS